MIKFCVFDLDGTLFSTLPTITHYINKVFTSHGIANITVSDTSRFIGHGARMLIKRALCHSGVDDEELAVKYLGEYVDAYNSDPLYMTVPYDGIPELIDELQKRGIALGVLSNKNDETTKDIVSSFFPGKFIDIRGGRVGVKLKPSPEPLLMMAEDNGFDPSEIMYIGDTGVDIETGKGANVGLTVGVSWGFREREELISCGADLVVDTADEILREVIKGA